MDYLGKMVILQKIQNSPRVNPEEAENFKRTMIIKETTSVNKNFPRK
jgi:hypothetical protein